MKFIYRYSYIYIKCIALLALLIFSSTGCEKNASLTSVTSQSSEVLSPQFNPQFATYRAFSTSSGTEAYVGNINTRGNAIEVPQALINGLYGDRTSNFDRQPFDLFIRGHLSQGASENGDFYFESPVLSPTVEINSITTALSLLIRTSFSPTPKLSRPNWVRLLKSIDLFCPNCLDLPFSNVLSIIKSDSSFLSSLTNIVAEDNSGTNLIVNWNQTPKYIVSYSFPILEGPSSASLKAIEGTSIDTNIEFVKLSDSRIRVKPDSWRILSESAPHSGVMNPLTTSPGDFRLVTQILNGWAQRSTIHLEVHALLSDNAPDLSDFKFQYLIDFTNRPPIFDSSKSIPPFKLNHYQEVDLGSLLVAYDPDGTSLSFQCIVCPSGLVTSGSKIAWTPTPGANPIGSQTITLKAVDQDQSAQTSDLTLTVVADSVPKVLSVEFNSSPITEGGTYPLSENQTFQVKVIAHDDDSEDELSLNINQLAADGLIISGNEERGEATDVGIQYPITRTRIGTDWVFEYNLKVSFLQVIDAATQNLTLQYNVNYDTSAVDTFGHKKFIALSSTPNYSVQHPITNIDDPPVFFKSIPDLGLYAGPTVTNNFNNVSGLNDGTAITQGLAMDVLLDEASLADFAQSGSTVKYTLKDNSLVAAKSPLDSISATCGSQSSFSISGLGQDHLSWTPPATTPTYGSCRVTLVATNSNGLKTEASIPLSIKIAKVNQAPALKSGLSAPLKLSDGIEGSNTSVNRWDLTNYFVDANFDTLNFSVNCDSGAPANGMTILPCPNSSDLPLQNLAQLTWNPSYKLGSPLSDSKYYAFKVVATDPDGASISDYVYIHIEDAPSPPSITLATTLLSTNENSQSGFTITISPFKADGFNIDPIDNYNYQVNNSCRNQTTYNINPSITAPTSISGTGESSFSYVINLTNNYILGNSVTGYREYDCSVTISNLDAGINYPESSDYKIRVTNVNRPPGGIYTSTSSNPTSWTPELTFNYSKTKFHIYVKINDPDGINDTYTLNANPTFSGAAAVFTTDANNVSLPSGTFRYTINFNDTGLNCLSSGTSTLSKTINFSYKDAATTATTKSMTLKINNAKSSGSCF